LLLSSTFHPIIIHCLFTQRKPCFAAPSKDKDKDKDKGTDMMADVYGSGKTLLSPGAKRDTMLLYPRSPSPAARWPIMEEEGPKAQRVDVASEEGTGWEISFDEDDLESVISCAYGQQDGLGGAGDQGLTIEHNQK
jgi:hypothetical protein